MQPRGFTLIEGLIVFGVIAAIASITSVFVYDSLREQWARTAASHLKQYGSIQATFKAADSDGNGICDYWVDDIAGLQYVEHEGEPLRLLPWAMARADGNTARAYDGHASEAHRAYWYFAMRDYKDGGAVSSYGANRTMRFGATAVPFSYSAELPLYQISETGRLVTRNPGAEGALAVPPQSGVKDTSGIVKDPWMTFPARVD